MMLTPLYIPWVGGLEILVRQVVHELSDRGHEVMVMTSHGNESVSGLDEIDGTPVLRVRAHRAIEQRDTAEIFRVQHEIARAVRDFEPDLVHSHDAGPVFWMYLRAARRSRRPIVVTLHNVMTRHFVGPLDLLETLLVQADWVTGVSRDVVDDTVHFAPAVAAKASVIRNGIAPPVATVTPVPVDPPRLTCIGRLVPQKGFDVGIDAFASLAPRFPDLRLTIAGDGPQREDLRAIALDRGVADRVDFLGTVGRDQIAQLLEESTAVVMPSRFEGLPLVALEAAWAGRPVVATRAPGLDQAVVDGETALVVEPGSDALAFGIDRLVTDPVLAQRLGTGARAFAEREYSLARCVDAYEALYEHLLRGGAEPDGYHSSP